MSIMLSGLNAANNELSVISNNIANSSTTGYRGARAEFSAVYNGNKGNGVQFVGASQNFDKNGILSDTGRTLDVGISGQGFFMVKDTSGSNLYTRSGIFNVDSNGNLVNNLGHVVQGYTTDNNNLLQTGNVDAISISSASIPAKATNTVNFVANLDANESEIDPLITPFDITDPNSYSHSYTTTVYDSLGNANTVTQYFVKRDTATNEWDVNSIVNGDIATLSTNTVTFDAQGQIDPAAANYVVTVAGAPINMSLNNSSQYSSNFSVSQNDADGFTAGQYTGVRIENDGSVYAQYTNGQSQLQGQIILANFTNTQELLKTTGTAWSETAASGAAIIGKPGEGIYGNLNSGTLENSNVDLTEEMVSLMNAKRNYQANSQALSAREELLTTLFNAV